MSKSRKYKNSFKLAHQVLNITEINFKKHYLQGWTELTVEPQTSSGRLLRVSLNCKQCRILKISVNSVKVQNFSYIDPTLNICPQESKKRNLEYFDACHFESVASCDMEWSLGNGELIIKVPKEVYDSTPDTLKIRIDFSLDRPSGGIHFVDAADSKYQHMFTYGWGNSSRLWFPCIDSYQEVCTWTIDITTPSNMIAVSCGELYEQLLTSDGHRKVFMYTVNVPVAAPNIALAVGCFDIYPDPVMPEITYFCLPQLLPVLKNLGTFMQEIFGFYEEFLSTRFPYSNYKMVFVDETYRDAASYSTLGIFSTNLLHSSRIIDQVYITRPLMALAVAQQYFGCFLLQYSWYDWWLPQGLAGYVAGLCMSKMFGSTWYQHYIKQEVEKVSEYESAHSLPSLYGYPGGITIEEPELDEPMDFTGKPIIHEYLMTSTELEILAAKAHLVVRMIQDRVGQELFLQAIGKLLSLGNAACDSKDYSKWKSMLISTAGLIKALSSVSSKDITTFVEQWICSSSIPKFTASYNYIRKKNLVELSLRQEVPRGANKFVGSMTIVVQEFDGSFSHSIVVDDFYTVHDLPCHSKLKKSRKRKMIVSTGEEVEIDVSGTESDIPILWLRVDPDHAWIRQVTVEQPDTVWCMMLKYERDPNAQIMAIDALGNVPSPAVYTALMDVVSCANFYYAVRIQAANVLTKVCSAAGVTGSISGVATPMIQLFQRLYGTRVAPNIIKYNDFSDVGAYFLLKCLPVSIASIRCSDGTCPQEVLKFMMDLLKYNSNQLNKFSDCYFVSSLIDALAAMVTENTAPPTDGTQTSYTQVTDNLIIKYVLEQVTEHLNLEQVLPSYHSVISISCLRALRVLQKSGHLPADPVLFKDYCVSGFFVDLRLAAIDCLAEVIKEVFATSEQQCEEDLMFLLELAATDANLLVRLSVYRSLTTHPPFTRKCESKLNTVELVDKLWTQMISGLSEDPCLRNALAGLYSTLYGRLTPPCISQVGIVIDLKEKTARTSLASPVGIPQ